MKTFSKFFLIAIVTLTTQISFADDTTIQYSYSTDVDRVDDGKITSKFVTIKQMLSDYFGVGYRHGDYTTTNSDFTSSAFLLVSNYKGNNLVVSGSLGMATMKHESSESFLIGDAYADYKVNDWLDLNVGVYGDAVESLQGLLGAYHYHGYNLGIDIHEDGLGLAVSVHNQHYSDNNLRKVLNGKIYYGFADGWAMYTSHKQYTNSTGYNGVYFNPEEYSRHNVGVSFRQMVSNNIRANGYIQSGISIVEDEDGRPTHGLKIRLEYLPKRFYVSILSDYSDNTNYRYTLGEIGIVF